MSVLDEAVFRFINQLAGRSPGLDKLLIFLNDYSIWIFGVIVLACFFLKRKLFWFALLSALVSRGLLKELVNLLYERERPFAVLERINLLVSRDGLSGSFPSGHASFLFAVAFSVYLFNKKIGVILIVLASLLSILRIYIGVHYPSDIIGGAVIALIAVYLVSIFRNKFRK